MLFDLRGKRRRLIQVVYSILAALFLLGFVGFGIGSDAAGGILDALGVGGGGGGPTSPQFESQIDRAEAELRQDPRDEQALLTLARVHFLAGQVELDQDAETGQPIVTGEARTQFQDSVDAWERYLETKPKRVDAGTALQVLRAYEGLMTSDTQPESLQAHLEGARDTAALVAERQPNQNSYGTLARYAYLSGDTKLGDEATADALAEVEPSQRGSLKRLLEQFKEQGEKVQKAIEQQAPTKEELTNPLQGLGGTTTPAPSGTPPPPAP